MAKAHLAFYIAEHGNLVDKAIAWWTKSKYSHVELVFDGYWYSTSPRDLKVRKKMMAPKQGHWEIVNVEIDQDYLQQFFFITQGRKYDWLGIFLSQFMPLNIHDDRRYFCSEWVATVLQIPNANRYSPEDLYQFMTSGGLHTK